MFLAFSCCDGSRQIHTATGVPFYLILNRRDTSIRLKPLGRTLRQPLRIRMCVPTHFTTNRSSLPSNEPSQLSEAGCNCYRRTRGHHSQIHSPKWQGQGSRTSIRCKVARQPLRSKLARTLLPLLAVRLPLPTITPVACMGAGLTPTSPRITTRSTAATRTARFALDQMARSA